MEKWQKMVQEFQRDVMGAETSPAEPKLRKEELRARLIAEEASETVYALVGGDRAFKILQEYAFPHPHHVEYQVVGGKAPDLAEAIDGLCDLLYIVLGTAEAIGIDLDPFFVEVHAANMRKRDPNRAQAESVTPVGKLIKPEGWRPPDIEGVLGRMHFDWFMNEVKRRVADDSIAPEQQAMSREQRISWVYGNLAMENSNITRETVERAVDEADRKKIAAAKREIEAEDERARAHHAEQMRDPAVIENSRRSQLPPEHPDHICGLRCDGQDGWNSHCARLREKLFGKRQ